MKLLMLASLATACLLVTCTTTNKEGACPSKQAADRRAALSALVKEKGTGALVELEAALEDENPFVRRAALRLIAEQGDAGIELLKKAVSNGDPIVRRNAIQALGQKLSPEIMLYLVSAKVMDSDAAVRLAAVEELVKVKPAEGLRLQLLQIASKDEDKTVRDLAAHCTWNFYRNKILLKNRQDWDHDVNVVQNIPLPKDNWAFMKDLLGDGHTRDWYKPEFNDSQWPRIPIETNWETVVGAYDGIAWYRKTFHAPAKPAKFNAIELAFGSVDEDAWVWLNGVYIGQHDLGPDGWQLPFNLDITDEIKWGEDNVIVVRVHDSAYAGGIYKPVSIQVME